MTRTGTPQPPDWSARAGEASRAVIRLFGRRLFFLPGTHLAATRRPSGRLARLTDPWHYWWQAHYLDCLVDAAGRDPEGGTDRPAARLLAGIRLRNLLTVVNNYYDDMAWLALATLRLDRLGADGPGADGPGGDHFGTDSRANRRRTRTLRALTRKLDSACTDDLGGGTFWNTQRDFKNTAATAPAALYYARTGSSTKAQALLDWLDARLYDPNLGLYRDGLRISAAGNVRLEAAIYSYNQGPVLGALLELGGASNLARAAALVDGVARHLTVPPAATQRGRAPDPGAGAGTGADAGTGAGAILRGEGTGDGGLLTGILVRYLALAARDGRLPAAARETATALVLDTAEAFWAGRRTVAAGEPLARSGGSLVFSARPEEPAARTYPPGSAVELSTQLQAWMILEAAAAVTAGPFTGSAN